MYWLGIDIGTGGSRALLVDAQGQVKAAFTAPHDEMTMLHPLWAEQRPENWWEAAQAAVRGVLAEAGVNGREVRGIGLSGQMHGLTLLDQADQVIRPALIWCDQRSQAQVDFINRTVGRDKVLDYTANPVVTGFTLPKLLWVRDNEPAQFERVRKVLLPKDYVRFCLTGEYASEVSDASGTSLFDVLKRQWSYEMCDALGLRRDILPKCYESKEVTGQRHREGGRGARPRARNPGGGRRRRSGVERCRQRHRRSRHRLLHAGNLRRRVRAHGKAGLRSPGPGPHLLSRGAGEMARDGRHPGRGVEPPVAPQSAGARASPTTS